MHTFSTTHLKSYILVQTMIASLPALLLGAAIASALPVAEKRTVTSLNEAAFEEAQQRDDTATRAFSSIPIKVHSSSHGNWLYQLTGVSSRLPMGSVCSSTSYLGISVRT